MTETLWYKDAIIYQTHIKAFFDSNNDGIGDFEGLIEKLDYIADLGVDTIWLLPFYPSPLRDDGYDIQDYRSVNPAYGSMQDVRRLVRAAHARGLKIITELVINHTSDQHPWFQRARHAKPGSVWRDFYVWSDNDQKYNDARIIFLDTEDSNWTWDKDAKAYFWHRFYSHQPDLNFDNPRVLKEVLSILHFWLKAGVDGLRLDAIPYLIERDGTSCENLPETHDVLRRIRAEVDANYEDRMLLAEANQWPEDTHLYFGTGDQCHMSFHFPLMPRMYLALAQEDRHPITDIMRQTPEIPEACQWVVFLRNHDELTLEMVTDNERAFLWNTYASDRRMRINLGIRRRLAPLMDNDRRKIELMNSLLFSMPGTPVVYYGDEIGMGDNIYLGDRDGVRTPMQWSPDRNAGFSRANPQELFLPAIMDSVYGYDTVNVEAQARSPSSLLNWMKRIIAVRRAHPTFGRGTLEFIYPGNRKICAYVRAHEDEVILCVVNLSRYAQPVELDLQTYAGRVPLELLGRTPFPPIGELPYLLTLPAYGFYWFLLAEEAEVPSWHQSIPEPLPDFATVVLRDGLAGVGDANNRQVLEQQALVAFARNQRWFAAKDADIRSIEIGTGAVLSPGLDGLLLQMLEVHLADRTTHRYLLPLAVAWGEDNVHVGSPLLPFTLAKARRGPRLGALYDATAGEAFAYRLLDGMRKEEELEVTGGRLVFRAGRKLFERPPVDDMSVRRLGVEQSNTSMMLGRDVIVKVYRRLESGVHPEIEVGRFLTEVGGFENTPPLLGSLDLVEADGTTTAFAAAFGFVLNQGDGWTFTIERLERLFEPILLEAAATHEEEELGGPDEVFAGLYVDNVRILGARTADMHKAFATPTDDPDFSAQPITAADIRHWADGVAHEADKALGALERAAPHMDEPTRALAAKLRALDGAIKNELEQLKRTVVTAQKTRVHGDYHLGQVLVARDDVYVLDFEGEPARSMEERRAKVAVHKDVAGMLRSFDYAAEAVTARLVEDRGLVEELARTIAARWRDGASAAFLDSYRTGMAGCASLPEDAGEDEGLLRLFLLEKALYEISYEAANRPTWLKIPLGGVLALLASDNDDNG